MLWLEIILAVIHIKNWRPTQELEGFISPIEIQNQAISDLYHLCNLGSNVYVFLHKKKQSLKSAKWKTHTFRGKLVRFNDYIIYWVHIKDQNKVIWVKDQQIYKKINSKATTALPNFESILTFNIIQILDKDIPSKENSASKKEDAQKKPFKKLAKA